MTTFRQTRALAAFAAVVLALFAFEWRPQAAGPISGIVFEDFNGNGLRDTATTIPSEGGVGTTALAVDRGVGGVVVTVFDGAGAMQGAATTDASGGYIVAATGTGPYRVEFTGLPSGYMPSRFAAGAAGNGTTVQFVPDGATSDVNLGILDAANFCQNNPTFVTSCFVFGDQIAGDFNAEPVVVDFPYSAGAIGGVPGPYDQPTTHSLMVPANQAGSVYGLAYRQSTNTVYAGAFMKKHAGFGTGGTGAIYAVNPATGATSLFADLNTIFGAGTAGVDPHDPADYVRDNDNVAWDAVGKISLGGLEISPDGSTVYVVNLADRQIYALPTSGPLTSVTVRRVSIPLNAPGATGGGADLRPFALQWHRGQLYVGIVNSAESAGATTADLLAYVYTLNPATLTFSPSPVFQFALNYPRGNVQTFNGVGPAAWNRWSPVFLTQSPTSVGSYPQPMLSGLAFDINGNLTLGLRDRAGDQFGFFAQDNPGDPTLWEGVAGGDTLLAAITTPGDLGSGWTLESNAQAGPFGPTAGAGNGQGPGGGELFFGDAYPGYHDELSGGAVVQVPGHPDVVTSAFNPGIALRSGGFMWLNPTSGAKSKGYKLYSSGFAGPQGTFSKANGFGELVALCQAAPIEVGNRIWDDVDGDGVQDAGEAGLDGVTVQLLAPGGAVLATAVTANGGQYYFSSGAGTTVGNAIYDIAGLTANTTGFRVRVDTTQGALGGRSLTIGNSDGSPNGDSRDSDATAAGTNADVVFNTGAAGATNHTYDIGFTSAPLPTLSLGNLVWFDVNNNGLAEVGEAGIGGVVVRLIAADGVTVLATMPTDANGFYLFSGLLPGTYFVEVVPPAGAVSSTDIATSATPNNDVDNDDNGVTFIGDAVRSGPVTLAVGTEPTNDGDLDPNSNLTVDFGFVPAGVMSLGNLVWLDLNNNGVAEAGEPGVPGVTVRLIAADGVTVLTTTMTNALGNYLFSSLQPGAYIVEVDRTSSGLVGYLSSTDIATSATPDNDVNNDDNGVIITPTTVRSNPVTLSPLAEPIDDGDTDPNSNLSVDFGFVRTVSLGDLVWIDDNNNALVDPGENGRAGVTVRLLGADCATVLATTVTDANGLYLFSGLLPGTYCVEVVQPLGLQSSTDIATSADPNNDRNNDDNGVTIVGGVVRSGPVTLTFGGEPIDDGDTNPDSNLSVDFGFVPETGGGFLADMCLAQTIPFSVVAGGQFTATYTAENFGPGVAQNVSIDGMLQPGLMVVGTAPSAGGSCTVTPTNVDCLWPGGTPAGVNRSVVVTFQTAPTVTPGSVIWLWFMSQSSNTDPSPACDVTDSYVFVVDATTTPADLVITAAATASVQAGDVVAAPVNVPITARFTVTNTGPVPARGRYALLLDQANGIEVTSATTTRGWVGAAGATAATWETDPIPPGQTAVLSITFVPRSGITWQIRAIRTEGSPADPNAANDTAQLTIDGIGTGGGRFVAAGNLDGVAGHEIATGTGQGETPQVQVFSGAGSSLLRFFAFDPAFRGGVRVASCDVNGDGTDELIAAQGPGGGRVRVMSVAGGFVTDVVAFDAFESGFTGGINVACADLDGDGRAEVVVGPDGGRAPDVKVYAVGALSAVVTAQFQAYEPTFTGGVRVSAARFAGSALVGAFNIATMPGPGRAAELRTWLSGGGSAGLVVGVDLYPGTSGGRVLLADVNGDGGLDLLVAPDGGVPMLLRAYDLATGAVVLDAPAGAGGYRGVNVASGVFGGFRELVIGRGPGEAPTVATFRIGAGGAVAQRLGLTVFEVP
ncbi:MAG: VCBS repeat-containing protein [Acidobacteria bacterium]|nr:VCBS repeat-containing protein [Acidobacteriota bacterium]